MFVTSCRRGWTQETLCYSHLEQTWPTRRVLTLEWSRQAFEVLLIGSGDGSSRISASACERWQRGVSYTTTGLSHDPRTLVVLGCRGGGSDRPQTAAEKRGALGYVFEKNRPFRVLSFSVFEITSAKTGQNGWLSSPPPHHPQRPSRSWDLEQVGNGPQPAAEPTG